VLYTGGADHVVIPWTVRVPDALARICWSLVTDFPGQAVGSCGPRHLSASS
jgi:hypothetical protein